MIATLVALCLVCQQPTEGEPSPPTAPATVAKPARSVFLRGLDRMEAPKPDVFLAELSRFAAEELAGTRPSVDAERQHRRDVLIGLSTLFDATGMLETHPLTRPFFRGIVQTTEERRRRGRIGVWVRFHGRNDAVRHFFVSAALCTLAGPVVAERAGRSKEIQDAHDLERTGQGQGFSFTDLAYNHAGIRYASRLLGWPGLHHLREPPVPLDAFVPRFEELELPEQLDWPTFRQRYYGENWSEYRRLVKQVHAHIADSVSALGAADDRENDEPEDAAATASDPDDEDPADKPETDTGEQDGGL